MNRVAPSGRRAGEDGSSSQPQIRRPGSARAPFRRALSHLAVHTDPAAVILNDHVAATS